MGGAMGSVAACAPVDSCRPEPCNGWVAANRAANTVKVDASLLRHTHGGPTCDEVPAAPPEKILEHCTLQGPLGAAPLKPAAFQPTGEACGDEEPEPEGQDPEPVSSVPRLPVGSCGGRNAGIGGCRHGSPSKRFRASEAQPDFADAAASAAAAAVAADDSRRLTQLAADAAATARSARGAGGKCCATSPTSSIQGSPGAASVSTAASLSLVQSPPSAGSLPLPQWAQPPREQLQPQPQSQRQRPKADEAEATDADANMKEARQLLASMLTQGAGQQPRAASKGRRRHSQPSQR